MTIKTKENIYHELVEIVTNLKNKQTYLQDEAKEQLEYCKDELTGEVDKASWHYDRHKEALEQIEDINTLISILEKI